MLYLILIICLITSAIIITVIFINKNNTSNSSTQIPTISTTPTTSTAKPQNLVVKLGLGIEPFMVTPFTNVINGFETFQTPGPEINEPLLKYFTMIDVMKNIKDFIFYLFNNMNKNSINKKLSDMNEQYAGIAIDTILDNVDDEIFIDLFEGNIGLNNLEQIYEYILLLNMDDNIRMYIIIKNLYEIIKNNSLFLKGKDYGTIVTNGDTITLNNVKYYVNNDYMTSDIVKIYIATNENTNMNNINFSTAQKETTFFTPKCLISDFCYYETESINSFKNKMEQFIPLVNNEENYIDLVNLFEYAFVYGLCYQYSFSKNNTVFNPSKSVSNGYNNLKTKLVNKGFILPDLTEFT